MGRLPIPLSARRLARDSWPVDPGESGAQVVELPVPGAGDSPGAGLPGLWPLGRLARSAI